METIIVICLLIVIALLLQDKIVIKKRPEQNKPEQNKPEQEKVNASLPDIMGQPKPVKSQFMAKTSSESQITEQEINPANLDIEYDNNEIVGMQIPQEELDEVFSNIPDFEEEEEEWNRYGISVSDDSLAQGVTFDELSTVGAFLQKDDLEESQKETAVALVQKLHGTDLFSLLENSIEGASQKIAKLLDSTLSSETEASSSTLRKNNLEDFDIGEYV